MPEPRFRTRTTVVAVIASLLFTIAPAHSPEPAAAQGIEGAAGQAFSNHSIDAYDGNGKNHLKIAMTRTAPAGSVVIAVIASLTGTADETSGSGSGWRVGDLYNNGLNWTDLRGNTWSRVAGPLTGASGTSAVMAVVVLRSDVTHQLNVGDIIDFVWGDGNAGNAAVDGRSGSLFVYAALGSVVAQHGVSEGGGFTPSPTKSFSATSDGQRTLVAAFSSGGSGNYNTDQGGNGGTVEYIAGDSGYASWGLEPTQNAAGNSTQLLVQHSWAAKSAWAGSIHNPNGSSRTRDWTVNVIVFDRVPGTGPPDSQLYGTGSGQYGPALAHFEAEPVNTAVGNYVSHVVDVAMPGRGLGLQFSRTYNSLDTNVGVLGPGWTHSYAVHLQANPDGSLRFVAEDGQELLFTPDGSGGYVRPTATYTDLTAAQGGGWDLLRRDQVKYHFDASGALVSETDRNSNALTFSYTSGRLATITDTVGRTVSLTYDGSGRLTSLAAPLSRTVSYTYDGSGRLASVTDLRGKTTNYTYDTSNRLLTITDPNGHAVVTNEYGTDCRISAQTDARGKRGTFSWNTSTQTSTFTDARGGQWVDVYANNVLQSSTDPLGHTTSYTYDANFNRTAVTDPDSHTTSYTYDANSNLLTRTAPAPLSYVETWTYTSRNDVATYTDGRGNLTTNTYDIAGNLTKVTAPLSAITQFGRDPAGTGLLVSTTEPRGKTTTYAYDAQANRTSVTSPLGNQTTMTYDAAGRLLTSVDPRGNVSGGNPSAYTTTYTYDPGDHPLSVTDPLGDATTYTYDDVGNRLTVTDPNQHATTYAYDADNHLASVTDAAGKVTAYAYDDVGNLVTRTDANSHVTTYAYDLTKRLTSSTDPLSHATSFTYDSADNLATRTDANAKTTTYAYDVLNRLTGITYANGSTAAVTYTYDANGNRTALTDGAGSESFSYDALDRLASDTRGTDVFSYTYDPAGDLLTRTYPDGTLTTYTYDDDGRMASASSPVTTSTTTLNPVADAYVKNTNPSTNYGTATSLLVKNDPATTIYRDYLRFDASALTGTVSDASLALTSITSSSDTGRHVCAAAVADTSWTETGITWSNAPPIAGPNLACVTGSQSSGVAYGYDLGVGAGANGGLNVGISQDTTTLTSYSSREGSNPPQLTLTTTDEPADHLAPSTPGGLTGSAVSGSEVDLAWTPATDNLGVQRYQITRNGSVVASVAGPAFADTGLAANTAYTYTVSAVDAAGNLSAASGSAGATTLAANTYLVSPSADAYVKNTNPSTNYGSDASLLVKNDTAGTIDRSFLKFTVPALPGTVSSASLRMYSATSSSDANRHVCAYPVSTTTWTETGVTWSNAPSIGTPSLSCVVGNQPVGWVSYSLGSSISGAGTYALALTQDTATLTTYSSRQGSNPPQLLVTITPVADTSAPSTPSGVSASAANSRRVAVSWSAASDNVAVTRYLVFRGSVLVGQVAGSVTTLSDSSVVPGSAPSYTVVAVDAAGNQSAASSPAAVSVPGLLTTYGYDAAGNVVTAATPDGVTARSTYDAAGRLLEVANTEAAGTLSRFTYAYDPGGNRTELTTGVGSTYYGYDAVNRLTSACSGGSCVPQGGQALACLACVQGSIARPAASVSPDPSDTLTSFAYDPVGNRSSMTTYQGTTSYTYDAADRLTSSSGPGATSYTYDANGNQLSAGSTTHTYDLADRMVSAIVGSTTETYTWSGDGIRLSAATGSGAATTNFLVDRSFALPEVAVMRDGTGKILRDAIYGLGRISVVDVAGGIGYQHGDALGSVTDRTSSSGISLAWSEYAPYGAVRSAGSLSGVPADPFGFTGQYRDATTGLYHLRARQYDPSAGRFISVDPVSADTAAPYVAAYVYALNDPTGRADPSGRASESVPTIPPVRYCDSNVTAGPGLAATGGLIWDWGYGIRPYFGGGVIFPGPASASETCSFNPAAPGLYVAGQGAYGAALQGGYGPIGSQQAGWFAEGGIGSPGANGSVFYVFNGWSYGDIVNFLSGIHAFPWEW